MSRRYDASKNVRSSGIFHDGSTRTCGSDCFTHTPPRADNAREAAWRDRVAPYYREFGLDPNEPIKSAQRSPFNDKLCEVVEAVKPAVVSFHFGLPEPSLMRRVKALGCKILGCVLRFVS